MSAMRCSPEAVMLTAPLLDGTAGGLQLWTLTHHLELLVFGGVQRQLAQFRRVSRIVLLRVLRLTILKYHRRRCEWKINETYHKFINETHLNLQN